MINRVRPSCIQRYFTVELRYKIRADDRDVCNQDSHQIVGALADRAVILVRAEAVVTLHLAAVQGRLAGLVEAVEDGRVRRRRAMGTALAWVGRYSVLAGLAHGRLAGRGAVVVAGASDAVALLPLLAEFPRDTLVQAVLRFLLRLRPGDRVWKQTNDEE